MGAATGVMASPRIGRLAVEGIGRGSWVEVRIDSARGRILYAGVVSSGNSVDLKGRRLWVRFGDAGNLAIKVNGVREALNGTVTAT